jgi:predicted MFS family arabinose efflux permease
VPDDLRGRVMSIYMLIFQGLFPLGSLLAGAIAETAGAPIGAAFGGVVGLLAALLWFWRAPFVRKLD